jgi:hypothetical protein
VLLAMAGLAVAVVPAGATKYAGEFMKIPVGARAVGMGGAFTAVADDATSPFWNPRGMVYLPYKEAFLEHNEQFGSLVNHNFGSAVWPMKSGEERARALGFSATWVGIDDIPVTPRPGGSSPARLSSTTGATTTRPRRPRPAERRLGPGRAAAHHVRRPVHGEQHRSRVRPVVRPPARPALGVRRHASSSRARACPTRSPAST